jgi:hypothetical protein
MTTPAFAQSTPSTTPIDVVITKLRDFLITVILPLAGAIAVVWAVFHIWQGGREGVSNFAKTLISILIGLAAVGLIQLLEAFASGRGR